ncbi:MAG: hypothetical protein Q7J09_11495, partial [Methanocalculus sp.]|uniref:hypothetical protein n=1 Tax=Methanocalculus sp. TaxID=2004547 RepID=UPI0027266E0F
MYRDKMIKIGVISILLCLLIGGVSASQTEQWNVGVTFTAGATTNDLAFGVHPDGTDGFDNGLDVPAPPAPPGATVDSYFPLADMFFDRLYTDIRGLIDADHPDRTWDLNVKSTTEQMTLSWNPQ